MDPSNSTLAISLSIHFSVDQESFSAQLRDSGRSLISGPERAQRLGHKNRHFVFSSRPLSLVREGLEAERWEGEGAGGGSGGGRNEKGEGSGYCAACVCVGGRIPAGGFPNIVFNFLKAARDPETASPGAGDPGARRAGEPGQSLPIPAIPRLRVGGKPWPGGRLGRCRGLCRKR